MVSADLCEQARLVKTVNVHVAVRRRIGMDETVGGPLGRLRCVNRYRLGHRPVNLVRGWLDVQSGLGKGRPWV